MTNNNNSDSNDSNSNNHTSTRSPEWKTLLGTDQRPLPGLTSKFTHHHVPSQCLQLSFVLSPLTAVLSHKYSNKENPPKYLPQQSKAFHSTHHTWAAIHPICNEITEAGRQPVSASSQSGKASPEGGLKLYLLIIERS